jgi:hypothetical protein
MKLRIFVDSRHHVDRHNADFHVVDRRIVDGLKYQSNIVPD